MVSANHAARRKKIVNTPAIPELPKAPMGDDSLHRYLWHLNCSLGKCLPYIFYDLRYGNFLFSQISPDHGEIGIFPALNILRININGTYYWKAWTAPY